MELTTWANNYRKLDLANPFETQPSFPYTDLKFRIQRNIVFLLKKLFLVKMAHSQTGDKSPVDKVLYKIALCLLKINKNDKWNILKNAKFIDLLCYLVQLKYAYKQKYASFMNKFWSTLLNIAIYCDD